MTRFSAASALTILLSAGLLIGCGDKQIQIHVTQIKSAEGGAIGKLTLRSDGKTGTDVKIELTGLSQGLRAAHFHENGKCDGPDFKSAGGHYNPTNKDHGFEMESGPHAGDMMNIMVQADGTATYELTNDRVVIGQGGPLPALKDGNGSALIIHEKADDFKTQPTGAAGGRIGCALIPAG